MKTRKYYTVTFSEEACDMRIDIVRLIDTVEIKKSEKSDYDWLISCEVEDSECLEYELRKAERRDDFCTWEIVERD